MVTKVALMAAVPGLIQKLSFVDRREFEEQMSDAYADTGLKRCGFHGPALFISSRGALFEQTIVLVRALRSFLFWMEAQALSSERVV